MSGHSKWSQIKRTKGAKDAQRGLLFSKLSKKITIAAKAGSGDPTLNFQLRTEIENAKAEGMPNDNIERAIKKATDKDANQITEAIYEGYGPYGTAFLIETATDNTNRTVQGIKHTLSKNGGSLGAIGSVAWQFQTTGILSIPTTGNQSLLEQLELAAIEVGAIDTHITPDELIVHTHPQELEQIKATLIQQGAQNTTTIITRIPNQYTNLAPEQQKQITTLIQTLEDNEDVLAVYTTANLDLNQ